MKANTKKKGNPAKKLIPAAGSLMVSAVMLATSTYAWFTMNKEVAVTGMEVKAHAEEGLLINEVKAIGSNTWDEAATANAATPTTVVLRPASTSDMVTFWHANSKKSYDEAGVEALGDTVDLEGGGKFLNVTMGETGIEDNKIVGPESDTGEGSNPATGNSKAETHIYYKDASFGGDNDTYQDGEGFYVKYTYYLKSSGDTDLVVNNLQAQVKATKKTTEPDGTSTNLEKSLRVGIAVPASNTSATINGYKIFAPVAGADDSYGVTSDANGTAGDVITVNPVDASTTGNFTAYERLNVADTTPGTYKNITLPNVNNASGGLPVYVYVWFEGEDTNCISDNLTSVLSTYDIDIQFKDADIY